MEILYKLLAFLLPLFVVFHAGSIASLLHWAEAGIRPRRKSHRLIAQIGAWTAIPSLFTVTWLLSRSV